MKKKILFVCTLLFVLSISFFSFAEEEMSIQLLADKLIQQDNICTLHLKLNKKGGIEYCFGQPNISLYDENGNAIEPLYTEMIAPLNPVPAGDSVFPITLIYTLSDQTEVATYQLNHLTGQQSNEASATPMDIGWDHLLKTSSSGSSFSIWTEQPMDIIEVPEHFIIAYIYGAEDEFLGITYLANMPNQPSDLCGYSGDVLSYFLFDCEPDNALLDLYGVSIEADQEYCGYTDIFFDFLSDGEIPVSAVVQAYYPAKPIRMVVSSIEHIESNDWRISYVLKNNSCKLMYDNYHDLILYDADGNSISSSITSSVLLTNLIAPFSIAPYIDIVTLPDGFIPVRAELWDVTSWAYDYYDMNLAEVEGSYELDYVDGKWYVTASIPCIEEKEIYNYGFWFFTMDGDATTFYSCNVGDTYSASIVDNQVVFPPLEVYGWTGSEEPTIFPLYYTADYFLLY